MKLGALYNDLSEKVIGLLKDFNKDRKEDHVASLRRRIEKITDPLSYENSYDNDRFMVLTESALRWPKLNRQYLDLNGSDDFIINSQNVIAVGLMRAAEHIEMYETKIAGSVDAILNQIKDEDIVDEGLRDAVSEVRHVINRDNEERLRLGS